MRVKESLVNGAYPSVNQSGDKERHLHLLEKVYQMESGFFQVHSHLCSLLAPIAHSWSENLLTLRAFYHNPKRSDPFSPFSLSPGARGMVQDPWFAWLDLGWQ